MWDGRIDPWRMRAGAPPRGKHLLPASLPIAIPPPFHVSPPFRPPHPHPIHASRGHPLASSHPKPSPPSQRHPLHPVLLPSSCPPHHHPSFVLAPSLQRSPSFPVPSSRPTPAVQPSRHPYPPSVTFALGPRPSPPPPPIPPHPAHPSPLPPHPDRRGVCVPQELHRRYEAAPESTKTKALQTVIEMKVHVTPG